MTEPAIHVVAGVLSDARGRVLLARRTRGRDLAGLWEFPGGKVDPGETPRQALVRELREELGIEARIGAPLIDVPQQYRHKRIRLDVHLVDGWDGVPRGLDGQALAWVPRDKLHGYAMPPGDRPVVAALRWPDRCLVTPSPTDDAAWLAALRAALAEGIQLVQLRAPGCPPQRWRALAAEAVAACRESGAMVLVNGDVALAQALGCGVHLRAAHLREVGQRPLSAGLAVSASCHDAGELARAQALECDFVVLGPVRATATHPQAKGIGWDAFAALREHVALPIYAIGGMHPDDIAEARRYGAQGIAAIRGLWPA